MFSSNGECGFGRFAQYCGTSRPGSLTREHSWTKNLKPWAWIMTRHIGEKSGSSNGRMGDAGQELGTAKEVRTFNKKRGLHPSEELMARDMQQQRCGERAV
jgi:hypothetical protein